MKKARSRSASLNSLRRHWNHVSRLEMLEGREMLNATNELITLRLAATDLHGNVITQVEQGEAFLIKAYIDDRRDEPGVDVSGYPGNPSYDAEGFYTAYFNVTFDAAGFEFDPTYGEGGVKYGPTITPIDLIPPTPNAEYDGYIERIGVQNLNSGISGEIEAISFRMIAQAPGTYDMNEAFLPHFHFDVVDLFEDPNQLPEDYQPIYVDGVPQLERLTGTDFNNAVIGNDEYFSLHQLSGQRITSDSEVYFEGVDLQVLALPDTDFDLRFVTTQTTPSGGEVSSLPSNVDTIDEWNHFYVEVYAQAPAGYAVQAGFVELNYDTEDFSFVRAIGRGEDVNLRYSVTSTEIDEQNGTVRVGFSSLSSNLGDDGYALIGRIQLKSDMELPVDYTNGELTFTQSSNITLADTSATIVNGSGAAIAGGTGTASHSFEVWPVIYDVGSNGEDRKVGISDFAAFISGYGKSVNNDPELRKVDFNNSGQIDLADFSLFIQNYGQSDQAATFRNYPDGYPGDLGGVPLMGSSFRLEGEPVYARTTQPSTIVTTTSTSPSPDKTEGQPETVSDQTLSTTLPLTQTVSSDASADGETQDAAVVSPDEVSTDAVISSLDDQSDLIVMASQNSESSFSSEDDEPEFAEQADEVLAIWEDENGL